MALAFAAPLLVWSTRSNGRFVVGRSPVDRIHRPSPVARTVGRGDRRRVQPIRSGWCPLPPSTALPRRSRAPAGLQPKRSVRSIHTRQLPEMHWTGRVEIYAVGSSHVEAVREAWIFPRSPYNCVHYLPRQFVRAMASIMVTPNSYDPGLSSDTVLPDTDVECPIPNPTQSATVAIKLQWSRTISA
jgi:hypothetical protein